MQTPSKKLVAASLLLLTFMGGCKKKTKKIDAQKDSLFSKKHKSKHDKKNQAVDPLELDSDSMKSFALDDKISKHATTSKTTDKNSPLFSWEDADAEKSKSQFKTLHFDFDKDTVKPTEQENLKHNIKETKAIEAKNAKHSKTIVIEGHACHSAGSAAYNMTLSEKRARHVAEKFAKEGIDAADIKIAPRGQEMPVRKGGNRQEQAVNRRVEEYAIDSN